MFHVQVRTQHKKMPSPNWDTINQQVVSTSRKGTVRILLVEDDKRLAGLIQRMLEGERYSVDIMYDGSEGAELALRGIHDIVIIDWMLPGRDGPSICRAIRSAKLPMGILLLTARSQVEDRVAGLDSGADDYLTKPFAVDELLARLRSISRRFQPESADPLELRVGSLVMDLRMHALRRNESPIDLTKTEWDLLEYFMRHPNQILTRENILDYVWSYEGKVRLDLVDVYVSYLRQKLNLPGKLDLINTVRGVGYRLDPDHA
jgi:two-component system, OmpR family, response regulator